MRFYHECDFTTKRIVYIDHCTLIEDAEAQGIGDLEWCKRRVLRHEIIHAFLLESGLKENSHSPDGWGNSEEIVDWIALMHHKLHWAFLEVGCAEGYLPATLETILNS